MGIGSIFGGIVDGHNRAEARLKAEEMEKYPVTYIDVNERSDERNDVKIVENDDLKDLVQQQAISTDVLV